MMRQFILLVATMVVSTFSFADIQSTPQASPLMKSLGSAWKTPQATPAKQTQHDITTVYGGADIISRRPTLAPHMTTA